MAYTTINKSTAHFNTKLYTGNGGTNALTGVGFQPDWTWIKNRTSGQDHQVYDAVRTATKTINSNSSNAESTVVNGLTAFGTDGFTLGDHNESNDSGDSYASWNWKAGTTFSNNAGANGADIASSGSINTTAGFSIIKATSDSAADKNIAHGLGVVPDVIFSKNLDSGYNWDIYFKALGYNSALRLNSNNQANLTGRWGSSAFTANTFQAKHNYSCSNGDEYVYYCFAEKKGYSKFGTYIGNGNTDGAFIYTGFKPAFVMTKRTDSTSNWFMFDDKRDGYNPKNDRLIADTADAEADPGGFDILSNGFKLRFTSGNANGSGGSYIYMAFGQSLVGSNNVPATAR